MELEEIEVFIEKDGQVRIEVRGLKGTACLTATKDLEKALGGEIVQREMTPEANTGASEGNSQQQWQQSRS